MMTCSTGRKEGASVSYPFHRPGQQDFAVAETAGFVDWTTGWTTDDQTFDRNSNPGRSPPPEPGLRMMPPGANDPAPTEAFSNRVCQC